MSGTIHGVLLILIVLVAAFALYLGYDLFRRGGNNLGEGEGSAMGFRVRLSQVPPGLFFVAFAAAVVGYITVQPHISKSSRTTERSQTPAEQAGTTRPPKVNFEVPQANKAAPEQGGVVTPVQEAPKADLRPAPVNYPSHGQAAGTGSEATTSSIVRSYGQVVTIQQDEVIYGRPLPQASTPAATTQQSAEAASPSPHETIGTSKEGMSDRTTHAWVEMDATELTVDGSRLFTLTVTDETSGESFEVITNGPVPDTPENRALYPPLSAAGRRTEPLGN